MLLLPSAVAQEEEEDLQEEEVEEEQRAACRIGDAGAKVRLSVIHAGELSETASHRQPPPGDCVLENNTAVQKSEKARLNLVPSLGGQLEGH